MSRQLDGRGCENYDLAKAEPAESTAMLGVRPWATDPELAARLWRLSERLTGAAFG